MVFGNMKFILVILGIVLTLSFISASNVTVWQGQSYSGTGFNSGDHSFNFTVYDSLTGGTSCYTNSTTLTLGTWGQWKTEQHNVWVNCNDSSNDYFLNINIDGIDQGARRRLTVQDFLRRDVNDIMQQNITADWGFMNINWSDVQNAPTASWLAGGNASWNQSHADTLYAVIGVGADNSSWNQSFANTLYILTSEESNLNVNQSDYWDDMGTINATQMENSGGALNILESWLTTFWDMIWGTKTTDDLTQGSTNFYGNRSWNESKSLDLHYTKTQTDSNLSLYILLTDQSFNETNLANSINSTINIMNLGFYNKTALDINFSLYYLQTDINSMNASWLSTYNATYDANKGNLSWNESKSLELHYLKSDVDTNLSLYLLLTDERFNDTALINSVNTTSNIQALSFYTKTESDTNLSLYSLKTDIDANLSLYLLLTDERYNETTLINSVNTSDNIKALGFYDKSEIDANLSNYILTSEEGNLDVNSAGLWDALDTPLDAWISTYNATYDAKVSFPGFTDLLTDYSFTDNSATWDALVTDNSSWSQSHANTLYWDINLGSYNATYDAKVSFPGFTDLLTDYSFTDNSATWDALVTDNSSWSQSHANTLYRSNSWDNFTGIPHATPSDNDVTHFSLADEIYDWIIGLSYITNAVSDLTNYYLKTETDANFSLYYPKTDIDTNFSLYILNNTDAGYVATFDKIKLAADTTNHIISDNATCVIITGDTSTLYIC